MPQKQFLYISLIFITLLALCWQQTVRADETRNDSFKKGIALVDIENVIERSAAAKSANQLLEKKSGQFQTDLEKQEEGLRKEEEALAKDQEKLSAEAFEKKHQAFRNKVLEFQRKVQTKRLHIGNMNDQINKKIIDAYSDIIAKIAKKNNYFLVLPMSQTLYSEDSQDITEEVLKELNKKLPKIDVADIKDSN